MESLIPCRVLFSDRHLVAVFFNATVERLVLQSVIARRKRKVCTAVS
jgi:hypothetical protein